MVLCFHILNQNIYVQFSKTVHFTPFCGMLNLKVLFPTGVVSKAASVSVGERYGSPSQSREGSPQRGGSAMSNNLSDAKKGNNFLISDLIVSLYPNTFMDLIMYMAI